MTFHRWTACRLVTITGLLVLCLEVRSNAAAIDSASCARFIALSVPDTTITSATMVAASGRLPEFCNVRGRVETEINFELWLPTNWNGKFYHQGTGGFAGTIPSPAGAGLERGYAVVLTDTGHQGVGGDGSWALGRADRQVNFGYRAVHVVTVAAKRIVELAYTKPPAVSYFDGCSNGGRQALMEAQRYPGDFDGISAGAPAMDWSGIMLGFNWNQQAIKAAPIPPEKLSVIEKAAVAQCDASDGLIDGLVDNPRSCSFDPRKLACSRSDAADCLTAAQVAAYEKIASGPRNSRGESLHPGFPPGAEDGGSGWQAWISGPGRPAPPANGAPAQFMFQDQFLKFFLFSNPRYDSMTFNFDIDTPAVRATDATLSAINPDLRAYKARGGKLIVWHGWSDAALTADRTVQYYNDVVRTLGGRENVDSFLRLFLAPGMHHCGGGPGLNTLDPLTALERWVEGGSAPNSIVASNAGTTGVRRTRPLCPYPQVASYVGSGDVNDAKNFVCGQPPR